MKTLQDLVTDAAMLEGLCQGAIELFDGLKGPANKSSNALYALLNVLEGRLCELSSELDRLECDERRAAREAKAAAEPVAA